MTDDELQYEIDQAYLRLCTAQTPEERHEHNAEMCRLIKLRSPTRVAEMERQRGLAAD